MQYASYQDNHSVNKLFRNDTSVSSSQTAASLPAAVAHSTETLKKDLDYVKQMSTKALELTKHPKDLYKLLKDDVNHKLLSIRNRSGPLVWQQVIVPAIREQELFKFMKQNDILTFYQQNKLRGYDGDANIIDMLYYEDTYCPVKDTAAACFRAFYDADCSQALRARKDFFEQEIRSVIEAAAAQKKKKRIFSIAAGKMREIRNLLPLLRENSKWIEIVVLDQDKISLDTLNREYIPQLPEGTIRIVNAKIAELLKGNITVKDLGQFDLVYSAGLYDYLRERTGVRLASQMFDFLRPGGVMYLTNYSTDTKNSGYMDAFLDWSLIYRNKQEVERLAQDIPSGGIASKRTWIDKWDCVIYSRIEKGKMIQSRM